MTNVAFVSRSHWRLKFLCSVERSRLSGWHVACSLWGLIAGRCSRKGGQGHRSSLAWERQARSAQHSRTWPAGRSDRHGRHGDGQPTALRRRRVLGSSTAKRFRSMADYVAVTGTRGGATAAGRPFMLPSLTTRSRIAGISRTRTLPPRFGISTRRFRSGR